MKQIVLFLVCLVATGAMAQRDLTPGKRRKDVFGGAGDYKEYRYFGLMLNGGLTYQFTRSNKNNTVYNTTDITGRPIDYMFDPEGRLGAFLELGLAHFPKKRGKLSEMLHYVFISYFDWALGFKLLGGTENTTIHYYLPNGDLVNTAYGSGKFYNGYVYGRFTLHKNIKLSKRHFIDNGLGINFDYRVLEGDKGYDGAVMASDQYFHKPFVVQLHYNLGIGFRLNRRSMLIPGVQMPIMGIQEWRGGCAALKWFSSNYVPAQFQLKWIYLFEKKSKGCTPARVNDQDKETMENNR